MSQLTLRFKSVCRHAVTWILENKT